MLYLLIERGRMMFVLTSGSNDTGWGRPIAVFTERKLIKKYIESDMKEHYGNALENLTIDVSKRNDGFTEMFSVRVSADRKNDCGCALDYEIFHVEVDPITSSTSNVETENFFD
jgi:hypothetical protein